MTMAEVPKHIHEHLSHLVNLNRKERMDDKSIFQCLVLSVLQTSVHVVP
jgi:hypothetical protein